MSRPFDWITFDCYGTLVDWETGIYEAFCAAAGRELDRAAVLATYHRVEPAVQGERFRRYRDVLAEVATRVDERLRLGIGSAARGFLAETLPGWPAFADTGPSLERIKGAGYSLGILSNVDDDLLEGTLLRLPIEFDLCITAEQIGSYKPAAGHFMHARGELGGARWLHAAQSYFHDVVPAGRHGVPVAWINRKGEAAGAAGQPDHEFPSLVQLAEFLT